MPWTEDPLLTEELPCSSLCADNRHKFNFRPCHSAQYFIAHVCADTVTQTIPGPDARPSLTPSSFCTSCCAYGLCMASCDAARTEDPASAASHWNTFQVRMNIHELHLAFLLNAVSDVVEVQVPGTQGRSTWQRCLHSSRALQKDPYGVRHGNEIK
jgi:sulfatase maturation enzyme AslB (radical SAM superfamily)